jgi:flagellar hook-associated protein 3 FlgL
MIDSIDSSSQQFLYALDRLNRKLDRDQQQISSGKRILNASDAPDQIGELLRVRSAIAQNDEIKDNLATYKLEEDVAGNAVDQANSVLESLKSLSSLSLSGSLTTDMQTSLINQVESYIQDMVGIANTQVNGRYVFSGDSDQTPAYAVDLTQPNAVTAYAGSSTTRTAQHPDGSSFALSRTAAEIFDSPNSGESVFGALASFRQALIANNTSAIQTALAGVQTAQEHLRSEEVFYGLAQSRISQATDSATKKDNQLQTQLGSIEDADITTSILDLQSAEFQREAAFSARSKVPQTSLFDYMK